MTGHPEAALAREMRQCYSAIALVTDMDAGAESGEGVGQEEVFALFKANLERLTGILTPDHRDAPGPRRLLLLDLGRRDRAHLRHALISPEHLFDAGLGSLHRHDADEVLHRGRRR